MALKLKDLANIMKHIDICMLTTKAGKALETRPMSNNQNVDYDGDSYFFTLGSKAVVKEIKKDANVNLALSGHHSLINRKSVYISIIGKAKLVTDKKKFAENWTKDLDIWFKNGIDTKGLILIHVKAKSIRYWDGWEEGVVKLSAKK